MGDIKLELLELASVVGRMIKFHDWGGVKKYFFEISDVLGQGARLRHFLGFLGGCKSWLYVSYPGNKFGFSLVKLAMLGFS